MTHSPIRPFWPAALVLALTAALAVFAAVEIRTTRQSVQRTLESSAVSIAEAVARGSENAIRADGEVVDLATRRLLDNARLLRRLDAIEPLTDDILVEAADENGLHRVHVFNAEGARIASSGPRPPFAGSAGMGDAPEHLDPILKEGRSEMVTGFREARGQPGDRLAVAVRRVEGGAIVVNIDASDLLAFRKAAGFGRLIQEAGANPGVAYVLIQDPAGIVAASYQIDAISAISDDAFLSAAIREGVTRSRRTTFDGSPVFETVLPFSLEDRHDALLRIGLSAAALVEADRQVGQRLAALGGLVGLLAVAGFGYVRISRRLSRARETQSRILDRMEECVLAVGRDRTVRLANPAAERLFAEGGSLVGRSIDTFLGKGARVVDDALGSGTPTAPVTYTWSIDDNPKRVLELTAFPVSDSDDEPLTVAVVQDLTERKAMEQDLARRDRMVAMGELASGVAHEIRNPLNAIGMGVQRIVREFPPPSNAPVFQGLTKTMLGEVRRIDGIVREFLTLARPPDLKKSSSDLSAFAGSVADLMEPRVVAKGLKLHRKVGLPIEVAIDVDHMSQVLINLIENAAQATESGHIEVASGCAAGEAWFSVTDTGPGIPPDVLERIFDPYYTTKPEGSGLGLSIAHRIVTEHGGRIDVHSEPGTGASFKVSWPRETES